jgi:predicted RNase H-like nuclease (RuvC/YqgF family)|tara:strand:+ start:259 stop:573 length:315 start_codon:yes stop_codon:yes gene_type:complete
MTDVYSDYGSTGVMVVLFSGMLYWFRGFVERLVNNKLEDLEEEIQQNRKILVKLIDRWNVADASRDKRYDNLVDNAERRHEKLTSELRTQSEALNWLKGKLDKK